MLAQESAFGPNSTSAALSTPETNRGCANEPDKKVLYEEELRNNIPSEFYPDRPVGRHTIAGDYRCQSWKNLRRNKKNGPSQSQNFPHFLRVCYIAASFLGPHKPFNHSRPADDGSHG
jgi:hypothetical protein